jgi:bifunctional DNA-binding transcriptional regulator/antitoxin component of YhaV-PrlF toxin-antitoxin module
MLCKMTSKNQITLPKEVLRGFGGREYFNARVEDGRIILEPMIVRPVETRMLSDLRNRIQAQGLTEETSASLIDEARHARGS